MKTLDSSFFNLHHLDDLSRNKTIIHFIDPRIKVVTTFIFIITVVSFNKYEISSMIPLCMYPVFLLSLGNIPLTTILKKMILALPFAFFIGVFNPFIDKTPMLELGSLTITGGWLSFFSIMLRFTLTVSTALILIAVTGFNQICRALEKLGLPQIFVMQLMFLYRYIFVLGEEAMRMNRARMLRTANAARFKFFDYKNMVGYLLIRTLDRAQRIHIAMHCRGFNGTIRLLNPLKIEFTSIVFAMVWIGLFFGIRMYDLPKKLGSYLLGFFI